MAGYEAWIWTELLAFDNTSPDQGVEAYLATLGFVPTGLSVMASASDFVMLHEPLDRERPLFPDVCARFGHTGNEDRARQDWTNYQLRALVAGLRARGVAVYVSVFAAYHHDRFHHEWLSAHPEARIVYDHLGVTDGVQVLARLADGSYWEDHFVAQLARVIQDYGFDGWHGPDCFGPSGSLGHSDGSDGMVGQFADYLGAQCPAELERQVGWSAERVSARLDYIWAHLSREWVEFYLARWETFWAKIVAALRPLGVGTMINSANTKSAFEAMYHNGMDYRRIARLGVDYLVVETVAANLALINGGYERHFDFAATLAEMKALAPQMKMIFLHGVKDVVESYDLLRHAPGRLERECYTLANQTWTAPDGSLERCASGFMVCLGDGLASHEWAYLRRQWQTGFSFDPVRAGELTWLFSDSTIDGLLDDYPRHGTWPGFRIVGELVGEQGLQLHQIARLEQLDRVTSPLLVPNSELLTAAEWHQVVGSTRAPVVLLGHLDERALPAGAVTVTCPVSGHRPMVCAVLHSGLPATAVTVAASPSPPFDDPRPPRFFIDRPAYLPLPAEFWQRSAALIRDALTAWQQQAGGPGCRALNLADGLRVLTQQSAAGVLRTALISCRETYLCPEVEFTSRPLTADKISSFPYTPLAVAGGEVRSGHNLSPLHIPPYGLVVMDVTLEA